MHRKTQSTQLVIAVFIWLRILASDSWWYYQNGARSMKL